MQTLSDMQRSLTYKSALRYALWSLVYAAYVSLGSIYLFLPPLLAVLFFLFHDSLRRNDSVMLLFIIIDILVLEAQKGFLAFTLIIYFLLLERFFVPKIEQSINSKHLRNFLYVLLTYGGYILFSALLSQIFLIPGISVDLYILYYIVIEFFIVSVLL